MIEIWPGTFYETMSTWEYTSTMGLYLQMLGDEMFGLIRLCKNFLTHLCAVWNVVLLHLRPLVLQHPTECSLVNEGECLVKTS